MIDLVMRGVVTVAQLIESAERRANGEGLTCCFIFRVMMITTEHEIREWKEHYGTQCTD